MKTSNKLLLTILGILLGSLLTYNISLRAEYRKGTYKDRFRNYRALALTDFDQVQVRGASLSVKLTPGPFAVHVSNNAAPHVQVTREGRRLVVKAGPGLDGSWSQGNAVVISCPDLRALRTEANWVSIKGFTLDSLQVEQSRASEVEIADNRIGFLQATAGQSAGSHSRLNIGASNRIQAARLSILSQSELDMHNVYIPQFSCQFSDSATASVSGTSLRMLKR